METLPHFFERTCGVDLAGEALDEIGLRLSTAALAQKTVSWDFHVTEVLKVSLDQNLAVIEDSVRYLRKHGLEVIYDAEHFFDGYMRNRDYALKTLRAAESAGLYRGSARHYVLVRDPEHRQTACGRDAGAGGHDNPPPWHRSDLRSVAPPAREPRPSN